MKPVPGSAARLLLCAVFCAVTWNCAETSTTAAGEKCASDHPCGQHGYGYYWCYKDNNGARSSDWGYCCKPDSTCGYHGNKYQWCYNGNSWSYCHIQDASRTFTLTGKTCSAGNSCGQHGKSYEWCYVLGNTWDYCCRLNTPCRKNDMGSTLCLTGSPLDLTVGRTCVLP